MGKQKRKKSGKCKSKCLSKTGKKARKAKKNRLKKIQQNNMVKQIKPKRVAVYGTLLSNCHNNGWLRKAKLVGEFWTEPLFDMFSIGTFPYIMENGNTSVKMEVYEYTDEDVEIGLDEVEGVNRGLYQKGSIMTPHGKALLYISKKTFNDNDPRIISGDWKDFKKIPA